MPRQRNIDGQSSFAGGLNTNADESQLAPNELRQASNARLTEFGGVSKRLGTQRLHSSALSANPIRGGFGWVRPSAVQQLVACNGTVYYGTYGIPMTWTSTTGAISSTAFPTFTGFYDGGANVCYIADGGALNKWDGTNFTANIGGTPNVKYIATYNLRLFGAGDSANPETLYFSGLSNGDTLNDTGNGGGAAIVRTFANQDITGLMPIGSSLMIFHRTGISRFTGWSQDDISINTGTQGVAADVGTIAPRSLVSVENVGFFLSDRGFYQVTEYGVEPISTKIEDVIHQLDQTVFDRVCSGHNKAKREVWFYLPDIGVYCYNYRLQAWSGPFTGIFTSSPTYSMWQTSDDTASPILLFGGNDGFIRRADASAKYKDDYLSDSTGGTSFTLIAQCHRLFIGGDDVDENSLRYIYVNTNLRGSQTAAVKWVTSTVTDSATLSSTAFSSWGTGTWGAGTWGGLGSLTQRVQAYGRGTFVDITITDDGNAESVFSRIQVEAFAMGRRY